MSVEGLPGNAEFGAQLGDLGFGLAHRSLGKAQLGTMEQYKAAWLRSMRESSQGVPGLMELQTEKDWQRAEEKYGQQSSC